MTLNELLEKLQETYHLGGRGDSEVKVLDSVSGEIVEITRVNFSHLNGGEIHIVIEMDPED